MHEIISLLSITGALITGLLVITFSKLNLRVFQGVFLVLGAMNFLIYYFLNIPEFYYPAIYILVGEVVFFVVLGFLGTSVAPKNYATILYSIGLFPWMYSIPGSIAFVVISFIVTLLYSHYKNIQGFKKIGEKFSNPVKAQTQMSVEDKDIFVKHASVVLAKPVLFSLCTSLLLVITVF